MKRNLLQNVVGFIIRYIWIFCIVLVVLELISTMYSATLLLQQTTNSILQAQAGEVSGRVDGVLRLLKGLADDEFIGDTKQPLYDRAIKTISYQNSYGLYMIAVLDKDFNMVPAGASVEPKVYSNRSSRQYLQRMKETGTYQVTDTIISQTDGTTRNYTIAVPLFHEGVFDGGIYGSIYLDDIEAMLCREKKGEFFLLGRDNIVMVDKNEENCEKSLQEIYEKHIFLKAPFSRVQEESGVTGYWVLGPNSVSYMSYCDVSLTEWTLVYEGRMSMVLPAVLPMLLVKVILYVSICWMVARFGRRYLEQQLYTASHLIERVTAMQKELFRTEQGDYEGILELTQQGLSDQLTGLSTRSVLIKRFAQLVKEDNKTGMLIFLDLDNLKHINDTFGHEMGDRAILHFAKILKNCEERYNGIAARYGGDEFILVLNDISEEEGEQLAQELCERLKTSFSSGTDGKTVEVHGSLGAAFYPKHGRSLEELISKADLALYISKHDGRGRYTIFDVRQ